MLTYKFRLYPTLEQENKLINTLEVCRYVYNYFITNGFKTRDDMNYALTELKQRESWLYNYNSKMLQMVSTQVASAIKTLKELKKKGYKTGKLKPKEELNSFTYNQSGFKIDVLNNTLYLDKIGKIKIKVHRSIVDNIKQIIVKRHAGKWYAYITTDHSRVITMLKPIDFSKSVGIDVGIKNYVYDSDGHVVPHPKNIKKMLKKLVRANRKLSRRVKGSNNYKKAKKWYQIVHERIMNKRKDFLHKLSNYYANKYDIIFLERLRINSMVKNHNLARSIIDSSWSTFKDMLKYKARKVVEVEPFNTSIECSRCSNKVEKTLAVRIHRCDKCNLVIDRDYNASLNILKKGLAMFNLPMEHGEVTPVEILKGSMKQEATHFNGW